MNTVKGRRYRAINWPLARRFAWEWPVTPPFAFTTRITWTCSVRPVQNCASSARLRIGDLPPELGGLYLGGGYPELYAQQLSDNESMRNQIRAFAESGRPVYAECGGFMYLCQAIITGDGQSFPMAGMYPLTATMQPRLRSLGYRQAVVQHDCLLAPQGQTLHGHEFHYSTIGEAPAAIDRVYLLDNGQREGFVHRNTLAGYVHLHWGRTPEVAGRFVQTCRQYTED